MNRRTFLSALAATSLTPIMPAQIFASGGIVNPEHCGFVGRDEAWENAIPMLPVRGAIDPISIFAIAMYGDGKPWRGGIITT